MYYILVIAHLQVATKTILASGDTGKKFLIFKSFRYHISVFFRRLTGDFVT